MARVKFDVLDVMCMARVKFDVLDVSECGTKECDTR